MKIYELVKKLNTKVQVKNQDVMEIKKYYLSMYRASMVEMYDKGYISDPTVFNKKELFKNIVDMKIRYIIGVTGKIELTEDYIGFALAKYKDDEDKVEFLSLLLKAVKYRDISTNIDKFYDDCELYNGSKKKVSLNIVQAASRIYMKNGFTLDEGVFKCIYGKEVGSEFVSLDKDIYETALSELGVENSSSTSVFVSGLTREEEIRYSKLILNGLVKLDGTHSEKLVSWLKNNKWAEDNKFSSQNEGLYNWILYIKSNSMIELQSKLLNELVDAGYEIIGMKSNGYYISKSEDTIEVPVGVFAVMSDYDEDVVLPEINKVEGYTGEVYSLQFLNKNEISYVGCPIELFIKGVKRGLFVDKEQTDMNDSVSWFSHMGATLSFSDSYESGKTYEEGSLESKLQGLLINAEKGIFVGSMSVVDYNSLTDDIKKEVVNNLN